MTAGAGPSSAFREEEEDDVVEAEHRLDAFERQYLDERSWENLVEKDGKLLARQEVGRKRKSVRVEQTVGRVRRGMIRCCLLVVPCVQLGDRGPRPSRTHVPTVTGICTCCWTCLQCALPQQTCARTGRWL